MRNLTVIYVEPPNGSVRIGIGIDESGHQVRFVGEPRAMADIAESLDNAEDTEITIEDWQVIT